MKHAYNKWNLPNKFGNYVGRSDFSKLHRGTRHKSHVSQKNIIFRSDF